MDRSTFDAVRSRVMSEREPCGSQGLDGMVFDLAYALDQAGCRTVRHIKTTGRRQLMVGAACRPETVPVTEARAALERARVERASFDNEAHVVAAVEHQIRLDFVTWWETLGGIYVTCRITVTLGRHASRRPPTRR
jgi:hypothetical protein